MKLKIIVKSIAFCTLLAINGLALASMPPNPGVCPSARSIQSEGIMDVGYSHGEWVAVQLSYFDTPHEWVFGIGGIHAKSEDEAFSKAEKSLKKLSGNPTPLADRKNEIWVCVYQIDKEYFAAAFYPLND